MTLKPPQSLRLTSNGIFFGNVLPVRSALQLLLEQEKNDTISFTAR
jgi:hypothetical protein